MQFDWNKCNLIMVFGNIGSGKTATCYSILDQIRDRPKYVLNHPLPEILSIANIKHMSMLDIDNLQDCVIYCDEPQLQFPQYAKRANSDLIRLYSLARQKDLILIFSTSDTRWVTKGAESYIDTYLIKNLDLNLVKQGSIIKNIIHQKYYNIMPENFKLSNNEAILYSPKQLDKPIKINTPIPKYWSEKFSKPYKFGSQISNVYRIFKDKECQNE